MKAKRLNPDLDFQDNPSFENPAVESAAAIFEQAETGRTSTFEESGSRAESPALEMVELGVERADPLVEVGHHECDYATQRSARLPRE